MEYGNAAKDKVTRNVHQTRNCSGALGECLESSTEGSAWCVEAAGAVCRIIAQRTTNSGGPPA
jgi:hypothetical protein